LRRTTSNDVLTVKIGTTNASVDLRKNREKCSRPKHLKVLGVGLYFRVYGGKTPRVSNLVTIGSGVYRRLRVKFCHSLLTLTVVLKRSHTTV